MHSKKKKVFTFLFIFILVGLANSIFATNGSISHVRVEYTHKGETIIDDIYHGGSFNFDNGTSFSVYIWRTDDGTSPYLFSLRTPSNQLVEKSGSGQWWSMGSFSEVGQYVAGVDNLSWMYFTANHATPGNINNVKVEYTYGGNSYTNYLNNGDSFNFDYGTDFKIYIYRDSTGTSPYLFILQDPNNNITERTSTGSFYYMGSYSTPGQYSASVDYNGWLYFTAETQEPGDIIVTVKNWNNIIQSGAIVVRYWDSQHDEKITNSSGQAIWYDQPLNYYSFESYYEGTNPFDNLGELWSVAEQNIGSGNNYVNLNRDWPYTESLRIFRVSDNSEVTSSSSIQAGTELKIEALVRNKSSSIKSTRVRVAVDHNQNLSGDFDQTSSYLSISEASTRKYIFYFTPTEIGTYYKAVKTEVNPQGKTDAWDWSQAFEVIPPIPEIEWFEINNDDYSTNSKTVTLNNSCTNDPTEYKASEDSSFSDVTWKPYSTNPSFELSSGNETKRVYFKVRNSHGECELYAYDDIVLDEITYSVSGKVSSRRWPHDGIILANVETDTGQSAVTNNQGEYIIENVPQGTRTITASKPDYFATADIDVAERNENVNGNLTDIDFSDFACKGTAEVSISVDKTAVSPGETFNVTVSLNNNFTLDDVISYLDLSFSPEKIDSVGSPSGTGWDANYPQVLPPGSENVYKVDPDGNWTLMTEGTVDYLVTALRQGSFSDSDTYSFTVPITVRADATSGAIELMYRGTIGDSRDPVSSGSGDLDQQGLNINIFTISIDGSPIEIPSTWSLISTRGPYNLFGNNYYLKKYSEAGITYLTVFKENEFITNRDLSDLIIAWDATVSYGYITLDISNEINLWSEKAIHFTDQIDEHTKKASEYWKKRLEKDNNIDDVPKKIGFWGTCAAGAATGAVGGAAIGAIGGLTILPAAICGGIVGAVVSGATYGYEWFANEHMQIYIDRLGDQYFDQEYISYFTAHEWLKMKGGQVNEDLTFLEYQRLMEEYSNLQQAAEDLSFWVNVTLKSIQTGLAIFDGGQIGGAINFLSQIIEDANSLALDFENQIIYDRDADVYMYWEEESQRKHALLLASLCKFISSLYSQIQDMCTNLNESEASILTESIRDLAFSQFLFKSNETERDYSLALRNYQIFMCQSISKSILYNTPVEEEKNRALDVYNKTYLEFISHKSNLENFISDISNSKDYLDNSFIYFFETTSDNKFLVYSMSDSELKPIPFGNPESIRIAIKNLSHETINSVQLTVLNDDGLNIIPLSTQSNIPGNSIEYYEFQISVANFSGKTNYRPKFKIICQNIDSEFLHDFYIDITTVLPFNLVRISSEKDIYKQGENVKIYMNINSSISGQIDLSVSLIAYESYIVNGLKNGITLNQYNSVIEDIIIPIPLNCKVGPYLLRVGLNDESMEIETEIPRLFWVVPSSISGEIEIFDFSNCSIVTSTGDEEIATRVSRALNNAPILFTEGLTAGELLPIMQTDNLILVGGHVANELVNDLIYRGKIDDNQWLEPGDASVEVVNDPFPGVAASTNKAIVVAGYELEDTFVAGLRLLKEIDKSITVENLEITGPTQVNENSITQFNAIAYYSDGSHSGVTIDCDWEVNSQYATINDIGELTTSSVNENQDIILSASYTYKSDTVQDSHLVTILNDAPPLPFISILTPDSGAEGTAVIIDGENFGDSPGTVTFNGTSASIDSWNGTQIQTSVPAGATTGPVVVHTSGGLDSNGVTFTVTTGEPEIKISQNSTEIIDTGTFDFGNVQVGNEIELTFTVDNTGNGDLTLTTPLGLTGTDAAEFTVSQQPGSPVSAASSTTFKVEFTPSAEGEKSALLTIENNDSDENPYTINLTGTGTTSNVLFFDDFEDGDLEGWTTEQTEITNTDENSKNGSRAMKLYDNISSDNPGVRLTLNTTSSRVGLEFYEWTNDFGWDGGSVYYLETSTEAYSGWRYAFGAQYYTNGYWRYVNFQDKAQWEGVNPWQSYDSNFPTPVPAETSSWHKIKVEIYGPEGKVKFWYDDVYKGEIDVDPTNDPLKYFYHYICWSSPTGALNYIDDFLAYEIQGDAQSPVISTLTPDSGPEGTTVIIDGQNFGSAQGSVTFNGTAASIDSWSGTQIQTSVPAGAATGPVVVQTSGGLNSNGVTFTVTAGEPEIEISQNSTPYSDEGVFDFGQCDVSSSIEKTFTIENIGDADLTISTPISLSGTNADEFSITKQPDNLVTSAAPTTFAVTFSPASGGTKDAVVTINNNDTDEGSYEIILTGRTQTLDDGLVVYYPFNGNANDESGNNYDGTINGATLTTDHNDEADKAYYFDGNSSIRNGSFPFAPGTGDFSCGGWIKIPSANTEKGVLLDTHGTMNWYQSCLAIWLHDDNRISFRTNNGDSNRNDIYSTTTMNDDQWHYVFGTREAGIKKLYIDGQLIDSQACSENIGSNNILAIGGSAYNSWATGYALKGKIDEVRIYNRALSEAEVLQLYMGGVPTISSISPSSGPFGVTVTINGTHFGNVEGTVTFNDAQALVSSWTDTQITCTVPDGAASGPVIVHTADGLDSNGVPFTVECDLPIIQQQPQNIMINYNTSTTLTVNASSTTACHYQWYEGESGDTANPVGTDSDSFITPALTETTSYWVRITNSCGSVDSETAVVSVLPLSFLTDTEEIVIPEGASFNLGVKLSAEPPADVSVSVARVSGDADINVSAGSSLTFTTADWDGYQSVTLSAAVDGDILNGQATIRISASGADYKDITVFEQEREERIPSAYQVIPEVMWAPASGGGTWLTEVYITDLTGGTEVSATFNCISGDRRGPFTIFTGTASDTSIKIDNLLNTLDQIDSGFSYYGTVGAVEFSTQDENHKIHVIARTKNGHYSKTFQGLNFNNNNTAGSSRMMMIQNLSSSDSFRSACGGFNPTDEPVSIEYRLMDKNGNTIGSTFTKDYAGKQFQAFSPFVEAGITSHMSNAWLKITPVSGSGGVMSYGATVNNYTNDPAVHIAVQSEDIGGYNSPENYQVIPEVMWAPSSGGGEWKTEIFITDVTGGSEVSVYYDTFTGTRRGPISLGTFAHQFKSGSALNLLAVLDQMDSGFDYYGTAGAVEFKTQDENHKIQVIARTYNGNYSKTFQGISFNNANTASTERSLMVQNLVSNDTFRSAFGAFNATADSAEVRFTILDESGSQIGATFTKTFSGYRFIAFNPFSEAGVPYPSYQYDAAWVKVEVISGTGQIMAFGSTTNNYTNDPAVHRGVLR